MIMNYSILKPQLRSPLKEASRLKPFGKGWKKSVAATLILTSLVDAFTILVIYLVMNSSPNVQVDVEKGVQLPQAEKYAELDSSPTVVFDGAQYLIEGQVVAPADLQAKLTELKNKNSSMFQAKEPSIIVQADQASDIEKLQPLLIASSYAGIRQIQFAVMQKDR
jgi:biopolymer transport protein ExbD